MPVATRICKVCGCEYEYCHTAKRVEGVFRWQDVACSPEHGSIYLARIEASRTGQTSNKEDNNPTTKDTATKTTKTTAAVKKNKVSK